MSDLEVLSKVIDSLDQISVPVQYTQQIAIPLINANNSLKQLYAAIWEHIKKKQEDTTEDDIQISNVEVVNNPEDLPEDSQPLNE